MDTSPIKTPFKLDQEKGTFTSQLRDPVAAIHNLFSRFLTSDTGGKTLSTSSSIITPLLAQCEKLPLTALGTGHPLPGRQMRVEKGRPWLWALGAVYPVSREC